MAPAIGPDFAIATGGAPFGKDGFEEIKVVGRMDALDRCALVGWRLDHRAEAGLFHAPQHNLGAFRLLEGFDDAAEGEFHAAVMQVVVGCIEGLHGYPLGQTTSPYSVRSSAVTSAAKRRYSARLRARKTWCSRSPSASFRKAERIAVSMALRQSGGSVSPSVSA